jgi:hypothetical protein
VGGVEASVGPHSTAGHEKEVNRKGKRGLPNKIWAPAFENNGQILAGPRQRSEYN